MLELRLPGVQLRGGKALSCDLLVDSSGRGSQLPEWLAAEGRPLEGLNRVVVDSGLGYAARTLAMPPNWLQEKVRHSFVCCHAMLASHREVVTRLCR